ILLLYPCPGIATLVSRGILTKVVFFSLGLTAANIIVSERPRYVRPYSPVSVPKIRTVNGLPLFKSGVLRNLFVLTCLYVLLADFLASKYILLNNATSTNINNPITIKNHYQILYLLHNVICFLCLYYFCVIYT